MLNIDSILGLNKQLFYESYMRDYDHLIKDVDINQDRKMEELVDRELDALAAHITGVKIYKHEKHDLPNSMFEDCWVLEIGKDRIWDRNVSVQDAYRNIPSYSNELEAIWNLYRLMLETYPELYRYGNQMIFKYMLISPSEAARLLTIEYIELMYRYRKSKENVGG